MSLTLTAWALAYSARQAGSSRGRFYVALLTVFLILMVNIVFLIVAALLSRVFAEAIAQLGVELILFVVQLCVIFLILRRVFGLSNQRTFAPFGALMALTVVQIAIALFILKPYVAEAFVLPTRGMSPTIEPGDRLVVNKLIAPQRWDVVAYWNFDFQPNIYCQRLIALPGERLRFDQGELYINDQLMPAPAVLAGRLRASPKDTPERHALFQDGETIVLGDNEFFLVGDNLDISADSRLNGPSESSAIVGVVDLIYWPPGKIQIVR